MAWDYAWVGLQPTTVTIAALSSRDGYGKPTFAAGTSYTARVVKQAKRVRTFEGEDAVSTTVCWVKGSSGTGPTHRVTLADATTPPILMAEEITDEGGVIGEKIYLG